MRVPVAIIALALLSITAGCAVPPSTPDRALLEDLGRIKERQQNMSRQLEEVENALNTVERRLAEQEGLLTDLQRRTVAEKVTLDGEKAESKPALPSEIPRVSPDVQATSPTEIYLQAFSDYASERYRRAIEGFSNFLSLYPASDYAANARYWLGECYYALQEFEMAVDEFRKVLERYPQHGKAPDALFKAAVALLEMEQPSAAAEAVRILRERYPRSAAAEKSRQDDRFTEILN